jgi:hypothetical protein
MDGKWLETGRGWEIMRHRLREMRDIEKRKERIRGNKKTRIPIYKTHGLSKLLKK